MPRRKRLRSVCHSIAHHAVSGLSYVHPHVLRACRAAHADHLDVNLLATEPCPAEFVDLKSLKVSLRGLREKFVDILAAEGFTFSDFSEAALRFTRDPEQNDDHCTTCRATIKLKEGPCVQYVVNYLGRSLPAHTAMGDAARDEGEGMQGKARSG